MKLSKIFILCFLFSISTMAAYQPVVSGTVTALGPLTDTQLRASPVSITGSISATNPSVSGTGSAIPSFSTLVGGSDGTNLRAIKVSSAGVISTDTTVAGTVTINALTNSSIVKAQLQDNSGTAITLGQKAMTSSIPVALASDQSTLPVSLSGNQAVNVAQINGVTPLMGAGNTGTGSHRVTIASDQVSIPVAATLQTGANTIGALTANQSVNTSQINGVAPLMGNGVAGTGSMRVTLASDTTSNTNPLLFNQSQINGVSLSSGNGVAGTGVQRVTIASDNTAFAVNSTLSAETTKVIGTVNVAAGQTIATTNAGTFAVQNTEVRPSVATLTNVASSATNVTCLASNANRRSASFFNDSTQVAYLKFGATASSSSYTVQILAGGFYEMNTPVYTGIVDCIWASANGNMRVTEY